ncbi:hypothetical protein [Campylobacter hyointestinalis]|uniref:hypothetical protein n=1 Tax=Campylobacter hyointestinalis TaxID=198 RepID=UPI000DCF41D4|nr:hypothetical protein [Campylobacter hyointestinalis]RAZ46562.1 hypothetical protein CHL14416_04500 [Campylobacter hyointestinalis subsp. lawsonii]
MKNFLFLSFLIVSLASSLFSADLLASLTNGKISDNSPGVKVLSLEEAKQVKGGLLYSYVGQLNQNEMLVLVRPFNKYELNPNYDEIKNETATSLTLTKIGQEYLSAIAEIAPISYKNHKEIKNMIDYAMTQHIGYVVTRNTSINRSQQYTYFTYKVVSYDEKLRTFHNLTTSNLLNNNQIIKTLSANFKSQFESQLGGLQIKSIR